MVQEYDRTIEDARLKLLDATRSNLNALVDSGYKGVIDLGFEIAGGYAIRYTLSNGHICRNRTNGPFAEISAVAVPLDKYDGDRLRTIADDIEKALEGQRRK